MGEESTPSPVSFPLFQFFFCSLEVLGVSCNLSIGLSLSYPVTCSRLFFFFLTIFNIFLYIFICFFFFICLVVFFCSSPRCVSWTYYQRACSVFVTGQLGRKEGRPMATEILSDSGPVLAVPMGSECFLPLWNAREHPSNVSAEQNNSSTKSKGRRC